MPQPADPSKPTVGGVPVSEFAALISPAAFLITKDGGTHDITRAYYQDGKWTVAHSTARVGQFSLLRADYSQAGLTLTFTEGFVVCVPPGRVQLTYRV